MAKLKAVIFDVDGTLAETERDGHRVAFNRAFRDAGLDWYWNEDDYGRLLQVTGGKERIAHYMQLHGMDVNQAGQQALILRLHRDKTRHYIALLQAGAVTLRPGVARLLREIRQAGLRLAIATTTTRENVIALLVAQLGPEARHWFDCIAAGDIVDEKKPAPDIYHYCLARLGLDAAECIALEDSVPGLQAATDAGLTTLVTSGIYTQGDSFDGAVCVLDTLGEPGHPCTTLSGMAMKRGLIGVHELKELHEQSHKQTR